MKTGFGWAVAIAALASAPAAAAHPQDAAINQVYDSVAKAKAEGSTAGFSATFAEDVLLIDPRAPGPIDGKQFHSRIGQMAERLRADGVKVDADYRVDRRAVSGDVAVDSGLMRQTMTRPDGTEMTQYARFLVTFQRRDGRWQIVGDASMPADEAAWAKAAPAEGLKFDA